MKKYLASLLLFTSVCYAGTHVMEGSPFTVGQCLQAASGDTITTTGSACGSGGGGSSTLAVTTGTSSGFSSVASSPTAVINFDNSNFASSLKGGATGYVVLLATQTFSSMTVTGQLTFAQNILPSSKATGDHQVLYCTNGVCTFGDAPGFSMVDANGYTGPQISTFNPVGGVYNDGLTVLTSSTAASFRITGYRAIHTNLRNNSGVEIGTSGSPLRTDPTGSTTQPVSISGSIPIISTNTLTVSGTVSSTQGTSPWVTNQFQSYTVTPGTGTWNDGKATYTVTPGTGIWTTNQFASYTVTPGTGTWPISGSVTSTPGPIQIWNVSESTKTIGYSANSSSMPVNVLNTVPVTGTFWQATQPISGTVGVSNFPGTYTVTPGTGTFPVSISGSIPIISTNTLTVSGTVTANQGGTWTVQPGNTANTTAWKVDGSAVTQPVSGTVTVQQATASNLKVDLSGTAANSTAIKVDGSAVTQPVSGTITVNPHTVFLATTSVSINGSSNTVSFNGSTATVQGIAQTTALPAAVSAGAPVPAFSDKFGRFMVSGIPRDQIQQATATLSSTTETVLISSGAAGVFNDLCGCVISNTSVTAVRVDLRGQGNGSTINNAFEIPGSDVRGFWPGCQNPFIQKSSASNWTAQLSGAVSDVRITCQYIPIK